MKIRNLSLALMATAALASCAAPTPTDKPLEVAEIRDCPTGTRVCRKGSPDPGVTTLSGEAAREAINRSTGPTASPSKGGS